MNATTFADVLANLQPSSSALASLGYDSEDAAHFRGRYELSRRPNRREYDLPDAALDELFSDFDPSNVMVGVVRFEAEPRQISDGWLIGDVGGDYLVLQRLDGEINVRDVAEPSFAMWPCAANGARFLDALALTAKYQAGPLVNNRPEGSAEAYAVQCGQLAGGQKYQQFYEMLLGVE